MRQLVEVAATVTFSDGGRRLLSQETGLWVEKAVGVTSMISPLI